jgi:hypothetical protein
MTINGTGIAEIVKNDNNTMGNVAGILTIPVCRNRKGEVISSVFSDYSQLPLSVWRVQLGQS